MAMACSIGYVAPRSISALNSACKNALRSAGILPGPLVIGYKVTPAFSALGRVVWRGVIVNAALVCACGGGMRVEGSSSRAGILENKVVLGES